MLLRYSQAVQVVLRIEGLCAQVMQPMTRARVVRFDKLRRLCDKGLTDMASILVKVHAPRKTLPGWAASVNFFYCPGLR